MKWPETRPTPPSSGVGTTVPVPSLFFSKVVYFRGDGEGASLARPSCGGAPDSYQPDRIPRRYNPLDQDGAVHAREGFVRPRHFAQDFRVVLACVRVE